MPDREDALIAAMNSTHLGEDAYPGDAVDSPNWPGKAPGMMGVNNALSPKYAGDVSELTRITPKPPVLWVRGAEDRVVADMSASDPGTLGQMGLIPGWPGAEIYPPQPMIAQTRSVLEAYAANGGTIMKKSSLIAPTHPIWKSLTSSITCFTCISHKADLNLQ
ncbi:hypothetical protein HC928_13305 [bacterium]|nr:hypothetical protein [bacterium]